MPRIFNPLGFLSIVLFSCMGIYTAKSQSKIDSSRFVRVEGGTFTIGCTAGQGGDCSDDEKTTKKVAIESFYISKYEVTVGEFRRFIQATGYEAGDYQESGTDANLPAVNVSWEDANAYCTWVGGRLPTEAEWEYVARGGKLSADKKYAGTTDSLDVYAWYDANSDRKSHKVGTKLPNELGLYDMSGNVWEWCNDWYTESYTDYPASEGFSPVRRGGSWDYFAESTRVSYRSRSSEGSRDNDAGFRVCLP